MTDRITKEQRSKIMAAIKGKGNRSTELEMSRLLRENGIKGWRRNYRKEPGTPDFVFRKEKVAVFVDGCFWHGCSKCFSMPKSNVEFWKEKIRRNKERDREVNKALRVKGYKVIRIWEHQIRKSPKLVIRRIGESVEGTDKAIKQSI